LIDDNLSKYGDYILNDCGVVDEYGNIYAILFFATKVIKFNTTTLEISEIENRYDSIYK